MGSFSSQMDSKDGNNPAESGVSHRYNQSSGIIDQKREAKALLHVAAQRPILAIADMDHTKGDAEHILSNPDFIRGLADLGKKDVYIERSSKAMPLVEQFYNGQMSKDELASKMKAGFTGSWQSKDESNKTYDAIADGIEIAKNNGIKIHFVDRMPKILSENPEGRDIYFKAREMYGSGASKEETLGYLYKNFPGGEEGFEKFNDRLMQERVEINQNVANDVKRTMSDKGAVVIYGAMHFEGKNDIDNMIGKDRCASVALYHDNKAKAEDLKRGPREENADYTYTRITGVLSLTEEGQKREMEPLQSAGTRSQELEKITPDRASPSRPPGFNG